MIKFLKIISLIVIAGVFVSCSDFLQEEVHTQVSDSRYNSVDGFNEAVNAAYNPLRTFYGTEQGLTATVFGTDTYREGADGDFKYMNRYSNELDPFDDISTFIWENMYKGINTTNTVLARASAGVEGLSEEVVTRRSAEARFLRGHYYFRVKTT